VGLDKFEQEEFACKSSAGKITGFNGMGLDVQGCHELVVEDLTGKVDGLEL